MNWKKILNFLFIFVFILNLTTVFADNLDKPKEIKEIFPDQLIAQEIAKILNKPSIYEVVTQDELNCIQIYKHEGMNDLSKVSSISGVQYLNNLYSFCLTSGLVSDLSPLSKLVNLQKITLRRNKIIDTSPLSNLEKLEFLDLACNIVVDLKPLSRLANLSFLSIQCNKVEDISPLSSLKDLRILNISQNPVSDISALSNLKKLTEFQALSTFISGDDYKQLHMYSSANSKNVFEKLFSWLYKTK